MLRPLTFVQLEVQFVMHSIVWGGDDNGKYPLITQEYALQQSMCFTEVWGVFQAWTDVNLKKMYVRGYNLHMRCRDVT